jgi:hypothetical protein
MREDALSASHWSTDNERVIAGVFHVIATREFMCVAFSRDATSRFCPFQRSHFLPSARAGELALRRDFGRALLAAQPEFPAAHEQARTRSPPVLVSTKAPSRHFFVFATRVPSISFERF